MIQGLINHYSSELPGYETNLDKASDIASDEVVIDGPQQPTPNSEMASLTHTDYVLIPEQDVPELFVPEQIIVDQSSATNTILESEITTND